MKRRTARLRCAEPAQHHAGHVDVAAVGLPGAAGEIVGDERGLQRLDLVGAGEARVDAELAPEVHVAPAGLHLRLDHEQHVAEPDVARVADAHLRLPVVQHLEAPDRHLDHQRVRVVLADLPEGATRHPAHRRPLVDHHHLAVGPPRKLKGDARPHDPRPDHHDVGDPQPLLVSHRHLRPAVSPSHARIRRGRLACAGGRRLGSRAIGRMAAAQSVAATIRVGRLDRNSATSISDASVDGFGRRCGRNFWRDRCRLNIATF